MQPWQIPDPGGDEVKQSGLHGDLRNVQTGVLDHAQ